MIHAFNLAAVQSSSEELSQNPCDFDTQCNTVLTAAGAKTEGSCDGGDSFNGGTVEVLTLVNHLKRCFNANMNRKKKDLQMRLGDFFF